MNFRELIDSITEGGIPFPRSLKDYVDKEIILLDDLSTPKPIIKAINAQEAVKFVDKEIWIWTK